MGAVIVTVYIERGRCYPYTSKRIRLIVISGSDESKKNLFIGKKAICTDDS